MLFKLYRFSNLVVLIFVSIGASFPLQNPPSKSSLPSYSSIWNTANQNLLFLFKRGDSNNENNSGKGKKSSLLSTYTAPTQAFECSGSDSVGTCKSTIITDYDDGTISDFTKQMEELASDLGEYVNGNDFHYMRFATDYNLRKAQFTNLEHLYREIKSQDTLLKISKVYSDIEFRFQYMELHYNLQLRFQNEDYAPYESKEMSLLSLRLLEFDISLFLFSHLSNPLVYDIGAYKEKYYIKIAQFAELKSQIESLENVAQETFDECHYLS